MGTCELPQKWGQFECRFVIVWLINFLEFRTISLGLVNSLSVGAGGKYTGMRGLLVQMHSLGVLDVI